MWLRRYARYAVKNCMQYFCRFFFVFYVYDVYLFGLQVQKKKTRVRVVEYWIEVAKECFNIGNFNSLMAIIAGLNMSPVTRLKKTVGS